MVMARPSATVMLLSAARLTAPARPRLPTSRLSAASSAVAPCTVRLPAVKRAAVGLPPSRCCPALPGSPMVMLLVPASRLPCTSTRPVGSALCALPPVGGVPTVGPSMSLLATRLIGWFSVVTAPLAVTTTCRPASALKPWPVFRDTAASMVTSRVACNSTWVLSRFKAAGVMVRAVPGASSQASLPSDVVVVPVALTVMSCGSSNQRPARKPGAAPASTVPLPMPRRSLPEVSTAPPSPPSRPPRAWMWPLNTVLSSAHTTTWPPGPRRMALASSRAPAATRVCSAWRCGPRPCHAPPTCTRPPPASPRASSRAVLSSHTRSPSTRTVPPVWPASVADASSVPATRVMPPAPPSTRICGPGPPITTWPPCCTRPCARTTPSRLSTVSANWPRAAARSSALRASRLAAGSSCSRASSCSSRRLKKISPSPSTSTCTAPAAARPRRPASTLPPTLSCGPTRATVPPGARMLPSMRSRPVAPSAGLSCQRPSAPAVALTDSVVASRPPTSTCAPAPKTMPRGLLRNTRPLACSWPRISDGSAPVTRLNRMDCGLGCSTCTRSPAAMWKLRQSKPARSVVWRICSVPGAVWASCAWPWVGVAPSGRAHAAGAVASSSAQAAARHTGRSAPRRAAGGWTGRRAAAMVKRSR